jgi:hypothetical protein
MNRIFNHLEQVDLIGKLADMKEQHYRQTVLISALLELLIEKGQLTHNELENKLVQLDAINPDPIYPKQ